MGWAAIVEQRQWLGKAEVQASTLFSEAESETTPSRQPSSPTRVRAAQPSPTRPAVQPPAGWAVANVAPSKSARRKGSPTRKRVTTREALAAADAAQRKGAATRAAASSGLTHGTPSLPLSKLMTHGVLNV